LHIYIYIYIFCTHTCDIVHVYMLRYVLNKTGSVKMTTTGIILFSQASLIWGKDSG